MPVLGRLWLQDPRPRPGTGETPDPHRSADAVLGESPGAALGEPLDDDELAAVGAFVRAGLVSPGEAAGARARVSTVRRSAAG